MKRSAMPRGCTPMKRVELRRNKPLLRTPTTAVSPPRKRRNGGERWRRLRERVLVRAGGSCDMCGQYLAGEWECHHRLLRSRQGRDEMPNLIALHDACHRRAHLNPTWAERLGYIVASHHDPATRPVWRHGARWELCTDIGWLVASPPDCEREAA